MPSDDLSSIPGLQEKHRRVLAEQLQITTFRALVQADRRDIHRAMRYLRPRPTLEQIALWQDNSRSRLSEASMDRSDWHPAASFAVVFAQREVGGTVERRLEVEQTEVEPEQERRIWPGWDAQEICAWMREQLGLPGSPQPDPESQPHPENQLHRESAHPRPEVDQVSDVAATPAQPAAHAAAGHERAQLRIERATVKDPVTQVDVVTADGVMSAGLTDLTGPVRVEVAIGGAQRGQEIHAVARILRTGGPGWNPQDPAVIKGPGLASFDLSRLPAGQHDITLVAWAPDGGANLAVVKLPRLTIRA